MERLPSRDQNRYGLVMVWVNGSEAPRNFEINRYCALREWDGFRIFKLTVTIEIDGLLSQTSTPKKSSCLVRGLDITYPADSLCFYIAEAFLS